MNRLLTCITVFLFQSAAYAQLIDSRAPQDFHSDPTFNSAFLEANGITAIDVTYHAKRDGQPMQPRDESDEYTFDPNGKLMAVRKIRNLGGHRDTTQRMVWSSDCEVWIERQGHFLAASRTCHQGDNKRIEKFTLIRWPLASDNLEDLRQTELFTENVVVEPSSGYNHTYTFTNNLGLPFKRVRHIQNELGYLTAIRTEWILGHGADERKFIYDKTGHLEKVEDWSGNELVTSKTLKWDGSSNLVSLEEVNRNSRYSTEIIYGSDALIHSYIRINRETNEMIIARFRYTITPKNRKP